jgi:hypothetical protein
MEKFVVVSTNNNLDYYGYSKYIKHAWNTLGWKLCTMITDDVDVNLIHSDVIITIPRIEGIRQETIAQASRLYAANYFDGDVYLMVSDMDLLPLSNYWHPSMDCITSYGHDLTDHTFIPMGYIGMPLMKWKEVMNLQGNTISEFERDAKWLGTPYKPDWESWWNYDWDLLTKRLASHPVTHIKRGRQQGSCFALGRVDRGQGMVKPEGQLIDAHLENHNIHHPEKWAKFIELFNSVYGEI